MPAVVAFKTVPIQSSRTFGSTQLNVVMLHGSVSDQSVLDCIIAHHHQRLTQRQVLEYSLAVNISIVAQADYNAVLISGKAKKMTFWSARVAVCRCV